MKVIKVSNEQELQDAFAIRKKVFVEEQNVPIEEEIDQFEDDATHFVVYSENYEAIGAGRFRKVEDFGKIERICVLPNFRKYGVGKKLMEAIISYAKASNFSKVKLNAQTQAIPFYEKLGFSVCSGEFMDAGIPHKTMALHLTN